MPRHKKVLTVLEILDKLKEFREKEVELIMLLADQAHAMDTVIGWVKMGVVPSKIIQEPGMPKTSKKKTLKGLPVSGTSSQTTPVSLQNIQHSTSTGGQGKEEDKL